MVLSVINLKNLDLDIIDHVNPKKKFNLKPNFRYSHKTANDSVNCDYIECVIYFSYLTLDCVFD